MRMVEMPDSPPNRPLSCGASECSNSAMARVIMAKAVPLRWVANQPATTPKTRPATAPTSGISGVGSSPVPPRAFMPWTVAKAPTPKYAACPKESMPARPASRP